MLKKTYFVTRLKDNGAYSPREGFPVREKRHVWRWQLI